MATNSGSAANGGMDYPIITHFIGDVLCTSDWLVGAVTKDDWATDWMDISMNDVSTSCQHTKV